MKKHNFAAGCAVLALCALSAPAFAQTADTPAADPAQTADDTGADIIVTGSARAQRRFDVSYAINSLSQANVEKIAPKSYADLLGTVPGIQVEATGGEVQNITRVRGIPTDRGYLIFQQDGLPLYHEIDGVFFNSGEGMNRYDLMTERVEIVRCLLQDPELLIMDEPTSVLTPQEADDLFVTLDRLTARGCAVLYISHRLE